VSSIRKNTIVRRDLFLTPRIKQKQNHYVLQKARGNFNKTPSSHLPSSFILFSSYAI